MQTILKKSTQSLTSMTSTSQSTTTRNETRVEKWQQVLIWGLSGFYTKSETDSKLLQITNAYWDSDYNFRSEVNTLLSF